MKRLPFDMVADWQPDRSIDLREVAKDLVAFIAFIAIVAFCGLIGSVAIILA